MQHILEDIFCGSLFPAGSETESIRLRKQYLDEKEHERKQTFFLAKKISECGRSIAR